MDTITTLTARIAELDREIQILSRQRDHLNADLRTAKSLAWFAATGVTRDMIETGGNGQWFGHVGVFADWIKTHSTKVYAEWNGRVYHSADLIAGYMPDMPGLFEHAPEWKAR